MVPALTPVERLDVTVLVDNVTDQLSTNPPDVQAEFSALRKAGLAAISGEAICSAHHGLSLLIAAHAAGETRHVLLDAGPEPYAVERNGARLAVDFGAIESLVLTHGHWDHCGGALAALGLMTKSARRGDAVSVWAHPGMFRPRARRLPGGDVVPFKPIPSPGAMTAAGASVVLTAEPRLLAGDRFCVSGEIPRVTAYERGLADHLAERAGGGDWEPDPLIMDERFLAAHVRDKGLVVFTGCSHAGIVNVLTEARRAFPSIPLHAVLGGLHLSGAGPEQIIGDTVRDLAAFGLSRIVPAHCTGWRATMALVGAFGEPAVTPAAVGKTFSI